MCGHPHRRVDRAVALVPADALNDLDAVPDVVTPAIGRVLAAAAETGDERASMNYAAFLLVRGGLEDAVAAALAAAFLTPWLVLVTVLLTALWLWLMWLIPRQVAAISWVELPEEQQTYFPSLSSRNSHVPAFTYPAARAKRTAASLIALRSSALTATGPRPPPSCGPTWTPSTPSTPTIRSSPSRPRRR